MWCRNLRYIPDVVLVRQARDHVLGQHTHHLCGICSGPILVDTLPLGDPRLGRVAHRDEALVHVGGAQLDSFLVAAEVQVVFAVGAAVAFEFLFAKKKSALVKGASWCTQGRHVRNGRLVADAKLRRTVFGNTIEQTIQARLPRRWVSELYLSIFAKYVPRDDVEKRGFFFFEM